VITPRVVPRQLDLMPAGGADPPSRWPPRHERSLYPALH